MSDELDRWAPQEDVVSWVATGPDGSILAHLHIRFEGITHKGPARYSVQAGYNNGVEVVLIQRSFTVPRWQSLNVAGLVTAGLLSLGYENLTSDDWPDDQASRESYKGTAIPRETIERFKRS